MNQQQTKLPPHLEAKRTEINERIAELKAYGDETNRMIAEYEQNVERWLAERKSAKPQGGEATTRHAYAFIMTIFIAGVIVGYILGAVA